jgi:NADH:ubiquinone oxidoreductase subunit E
MSLPIAGGPKGPSRPPTHKEVDLQTLMKLGMELEEATDGDVIGAELIDELAAELGVDASRLYAAAALTTELEIAAEHDVRFVVCAGGCQKWGALACLDELLALRERRVEQGAQAFDVVARRCLDRCSAAPAVLVHTPDGAALIEEATPAVLAEAVATACGD